MNTADFLVGFNAVLARRGRKPTTPASMLDHWKGFTAEVERGYSATIDEYFNELTVRDAFEDVFRDPIVGPTEEAANWQVQVLEVDRRFREALRDTPQIGEEGDPWWRVRLPRRAEGDFAEDLRDLYGVV